MAARLAFETMVELGQAERYELRDALTLYGSFEGKWYQKPTQMSPERGVPTPTFNDAHKAAMDQLRGEVRGYADTDIVCAISIKTEGRTEARGRTDITELRRVIDYSLTADVFSIE